MKMVHPEIEAAAEVVSREQFNLVYAPRGWQLMEPGVEYANTMLGRFVRSPEDLTVDETRGLIAAKGGDYPDTKASGEEVTAAYNDMFAAGEPRPTPPTETVGGIPITPYEPGEHNVSEVTLYLESAGEDERLRVLKAEEAGKARTTILNWTPADPGSDESTPVEGQE